MNTFCKILPLRIEENDPDHEKRSSPAVVYDDYADIVIFAKWVMDAPGIGERAHPSVGRRCPCTRKGIKLVLLTIIAISQPVFVWTFPNSQTFANFTSEICRRGLLSKVHTRLSSHAGNIRSDWTAFFSISVTFFPVELRVCILTRRNLTSGGSCGGTLAHHSAISSTARM